MKKSKTWVKKRHAVIQKTAKLFFFPFVKIKYGVKLVKDKDERQRIILSNHQTPFDQFFMAYAFKMPLYYLATEDIFSNGFISKLLRFAVNPVPIKKQTTDVRAVMNCMKVAKEGGSIAIFPEGNRTYSGTTEHISFAIVKLVKALKLPLTFFRIEGGYGVQPRWSDEIRKGALRAYSSKTVEKEEYLSMTDEELYELIQKELFVDEREIVGEYRGKRSAEYLERAIYVCPDCGIAKFESAKNRIKCTACGKEIEYRSNKRLQGVGFDFPFAFVKEWYDFQADYVRSLPLEGYEQTPLFQDEVRVYAVELYKRKRLLTKKTRLIGYADRFTFHEREFPFEEVSAASVLGRNKLNIYHQGKVYQIKGDKRFNALKYVHSFYRQKDVKDTKGEGNGKFLGL